MSVQIKGDGTIGGIDQGINAVGVITATSFDGDLATTNLTGTISNAQLENSTVSYGGVTLALGESDATPAFDLTDATNYPFNSLTGITTSILGDTTPKLGGDLNGNSKNIFNVGIITANEYYGIFKGTLESAVADNRIEQGNTKAQVVDTGSNGHFFVQTENVERFRIDESGKVGIGVTNPSTVLHIDYDSNNLLTLDN